MSDAGQRDNAADNGAADAPAFARLLQRLGSDGGAAYEGLRRRLIRYFAMHVPSEADALADVALDRLARRVDDGTEIADPAAFALGIARRVLLEARARHTRRVAAESGIAVDTAAAAAEAGAALRVERLHAALARCLDQAGAASRALILAYYGADGGARIRVRQTLARDAGISLNALRNRALRLRETLEACLHERLGRDLDT